MLSRLLMAVLMTAALSALAAPCALAQSSLEPDANASHQISSSEGPGVPSSPLTTISRPGFSFLELAMMWGRLAWMPASPLQMPSGFAMLAPGDLRWGIR